MIAVFSIAFLRFVRHACAKDVTHGRAESRLNPCRRKRHRGWWGSEAVEVVGADATDVVECDMCVCAVVLLVFRGCGVLIILMRLCCVRRADNNINSVGMQAMAEAAPCMQSLQHLDISCE